MHCSLAGFVTATANEETVDADEDDIDCVGEQCNARTDRQLQALRQVEDTSRVVVVSDEFRFRGAVDTHVIAESVDADCIVGTSGLTETLVDIFAVVVVCGQRISRATAALVASVAVLTFLLAASVILQTLVRIIALRSVHVLETLSVVDWAVTDETAGIADPRTPRLSCAEVVCLNKVEARLAQAITDVAERYTGLLAASVIRSQTVVQHDASSGWSLWAWSSSRSCVSPRSG